MVALRGSKYSFETVVVDDNSSDETETYLKGIGWIRYIRRSGQGGFIAACNEGARLARGRHLVFLNNDTQVHEAWLDELRDTFDAEPAAGIVGSKLIYPNGRLQEAGGIVWPDGSAANFGKNDEQNRPEYNYLRPVDYVSGASLMIEAETFHNLGGFDTLYSPAYYEDVDLAFKVRELGKAVLYQPLSTVSHYEGASAGRDVNTGTKSYQLINGAKFVDRWRSVLEAKKSGARALEPQRKVLVIDAVVPMPDRDAGSRFCVDMIGLIQELGYSVAFMPENLNYVESYTQNLQRRGVEVLFHPYCHSIDDHLKDRGSEYDAVIVHREYIVAAHVDSIRRYAPNAKIVFAVVDLHHLRELRQAEVEGNSAKLKRAEKTKERELSLVKATDCTLVYSTFEVAYLKGLCPGKEIALLGWTNAVADMPVVEREGRADIVFIGGYGHPPNVDAVDYFLADIWPLVTAEVPNARFIIVGEKAPSRWLETGGPNVEVVGHIPDLNSLLGSARLSVAPLRFGAGFKGKIAICLAAGLPVVTTAVGMEGMGFTPGEEALVADDAATFAQLVVDLYRDDALWNKTSQSARAFAQRNFSRSTNLRAVEKMLANSGA